MPERERGLTEAQMCLVSGMLRRLDDAIAESRLLWRQLPEEAAAAAKTLSGIQAVTEEIGRELTGILPQLSHAHAWEMLENTADTLEELERALAVGAPADAAGLAEFQLTPFLRLLRESLCFWGLIWPDEQRLRRYYAGSYALRYRNRYLAEGMLPAHRATVVVVAYNQLEMTRQCVESILKYTDFQGLNAELILVDHGSTDGTRAYFQGLGFGRVIHLKHNLRGAAFAMLPQLCRSPYYVHVANDTVVTKDWLDILLRCMDSDERIALAAPATCNVSNLQSLHIPVNTCGELVELAERHNRSDPALWNDRARVLPPMGVFRVSALNEIGFWDPAIYTFDFCDDDFSLRARRAGWRQVLCEDVYCYHRGSVTMAREQRALGTLENGRRLFLEKNGIDAWGTGFCYNDYMVSCLTEELPAGGRVNILGLNCGFGDTTLEICNRLRRAGKQTAIYHITTQLQYMPDVLPHSEGAAAADEWQLAEAIRRRFPGLRFDRVCMEEDMANREYGEELLEAVYSRMEPGGQFVFRCRNPYYAAAIYPLLHFSLPPGRQSWTAPEHLIRRAERLFAQVQVVPQRQDIQSLENFITRHFGYVDPVIRERLSAVQYYIICRK